MSAAKTSDKKTSPATIKAIKAKFPNENLAKANFTEVGVGGVKTDGKGKKSKPSVYYINPEFKRLDGTFGPLYLDFTQQILGSGLKLPPKTDADKASYLQIVFRRLTAEEFEKSDYNKEDVQTLLKENSEFIDALDIVYEELQKMIQSEILRHKDKKFEWPSATRTINMFCQKYRLDEKQETVIDDIDDDGNPKPADPNAGKIKLDNPLYRIRIPLERTQNKIKRFGYQDSTGNFKYSITDLQKTQREAAKRTDKKSRIVEIPARVVSKGQAIDINNYNAQHFVTYMSLTNGTLRPARITISMYGVSSAMEAARLAVWHHKKLTNEPIDQEVLDSCAKIGVTNTADDVEIPLDEPTAKTGHVQLDEDEAELESRKKSSSKKYAEDSGDELPARKPSKKMIQQPDSDDDEQLAQQRAKSKAKAKAKAEAAKVSLKKAPVVSDNEEEQQDTEEEPQDE